jgi:hypothetical protein
VYRLGYNDTKREEENKVDFSTTYALFGVIFYREGIWKATLININGK